jgi:hypothetical protein
MKPIVMIVLISCLIAVCSCSTEKTPLPQQQIPAISLSAVDKDKLLAFRKEIITIENLTNKVVKLAGEELGNFIKGGGIPLNLSSIINRGKTECLLAGETLAKMAIPEALSPEVRILLDESKTGLAAAYTAHAESFEAIRSFVVDKNPMALFEYRKKYTQAQDLMKAANGKLKMIMTAAGLS